jgi:hypothetical protein
MPDNTTLLSLLLSADPIRIVAVDGGGIYGMASATWLRQLCERDANFLDPATQRPLLAGISSGAVNALLLAKEPDPRAALLSGTIENFWKEPIGAFSHTNPVTAWWSLFGVGAWFGANDFEYQLQKTFGDMRLGDLQQPVLIATFNWAGTQGPIDFQTPPLYSPEVLFGFPFTGNNPNDTSWRPKIFTNLWGNDEDMSYRVRDVVYAAATPPGWRRTKGGIGDAGVYTANPTVQAIAAVVSCYQQFYTLAPDKMEGGLPLSRGELLDHIAALSMSDGSVVPHYWLKNFSLSSSQFAVYPTNPYEMQWYPPTATISLDASSEDVNYISQNLLGCERYHRLHADILPFPTLAATQLSRWKVYKDYFLKSIENATQTAASNDAVNSAVQFLESAGWLGGP